MKFSYSLLIFVVFLLLSTSCEDEKCGRNRDNYLYNLEAEVTVLPAQAVYTTSDVITVHFNFPNPILDRQHDVLEVINAVDFRHGWWISRLDSVESVRPETGTHIEVNPSGTTIGSINTNVANPNFFEVDGELEQVENGSFQSNYQFRFKRPGYYLFEIGNYVDDEEPSDDPISLVNECGNGVFDITYIGNNYPQGQFDLFCESNPPEGWCRETTEERIENLRLTGSYIFKVE